MRKILATLILIAFISVLVSCARPGEAVKGTGKGATNIVEGAGRATVDVGKGAVDTVKGTAAATGYVLTGRGGEAVESGKEAINATAGGIKSVIVEPAKGLGEGLKSIDTGIKEATRSDEVK